jgi:hypothetical protein
MEKLTINIPDEKMAQVKQVLLGLGIPVLEQKRFSGAAYREKISHVGIWSEEDLKDVQVGGNAFDDLKIEEW